MKTIPKAVGLSSDQRTQRWSVTCPVCSTQFQPPTTRWATQRFECPKGHCRTPLRADYNAEPPVVEVVS